MYRREFCLALVAMPALARSAMAQEASSIVLGKQYGLPYLPLMVMEEHKLVERHAGRLGIASLKPEYKTLGGTVNLMEALIGGQMHFGVTGVPGLATLWDKTVGTPNEVRALCAVQSMPFYLVTNNPNVSRSATSPREGQNRIAGREGLFAGDLPADGRSEGMG